MRFVILCLSLVLYPALCLRPLVAAPSVDLRGEIISSGVPPFSDTWDRMLQRDISAVTRPGGPKRSREVKSKPMPVVPRFRGPTGEEVAPRLAPGSDVPFFPPGPLAPQTADTGFMTSNLLDEINTLGGYIPPDTMGAIGPNHFVVTINSSIAVYTRAGARLSHVSLDSFFTVIVDGTTYPRNSTTDPRILFDQRSNRWFASVLEFGQPSGSNNHIMLAVSRTSDPIGGTWDKYVIPVGIPRSGPDTFFTDFETLGVDDNGVYLGMRIFGKFSPDVAKIAATQKASLVAVSPSLGAVYQWSDITDMWSSPQPAHNQDPVPPSGAAWFVSSSSSTRANIHYRRLTWSGGVPTLSATSVVTTPGYAVPPNAPANGSSVPVNVTDDRLQMAVIRGNRLWTCRNVGLDSSGGGSSATRCGCEWFELDVSGVSPSLFQSGRVYDPASSNPRYYYFPSVMVNGQGHAVMGFSGSKSTEYIGAYACGRLSADAAGAMGAVMTIKAGEAPYQRTDGSGRNRWGDYSYTSLDPNDGMSIWTIQEYASNLASSIWSTWTTRLSSPAPTLDNPAAVGCQGQTGCVLSLTGTGFYDPGPGYANRLNVSLTGDGISNYQVTYDSSTSATATFDTAPDATSGPRNVTLTNPDGQLATVTGGFTILAPPVFTVQPSSLVRCIGQSATFCVTAGGSPPLSYQWSKNGDSIPGATSSCYTIPSCSLTDAGDYTCAVSNSCGTVSSSVASLGVGSCATIPEAKATSSADPVALIDKVVTAAFGDVFYVQEPALKSGIRAHRTGYAASIGAVLDLSGVVQTNADGEREIEAGVIVPDGTATIDPVALNNKWIGGGDWPSPGLGQGGILGGVGLNNIGLLIRTLGKFSFVDASTFTVDDGSGVNLKCVVPAGVTLNPAWQYVVVTGISSCYTVGTDLNRRLLVRDQADIIPIM
ncbi:MAG: immunoglobulin domain-containing protein [Armatimonadota bacterium]|nr:immunoglobulin domain-containing protein [Armatimonadota bacterium]